MTAEEALKIGWDTPRTPQGIAAALIRAELSGFDIARETLMSDCENCSGRGHHGRGRSGKLASCEVCGGDEDALGRGWIYEDDPDVAAEKLATARQRTEALVRVIEEAERGAISAIQLGRAWNSEERCR